MITEYKEYFKELDNLIKKFNSIMRKNQNDTFRKAVDLLIYGMSIVERCQFLYLDYYNKYIDNNVEKPLEEVSASDRYKYDYETSQYAEKFYKVSSLIISKTINDDDFIDNDKQSYQYLLNLNYKMLCISARNNSQRFIETFEFEKGYRSKKIPKRLPLLEEAFFFTDRMLATKMGIKFDDGIMPKKVIFSVQPNSGKSFIANVFCDRGLILHKLYFKSSGIIRMTNTGKNALGFSGQCKNMLSDEKHITAIYPELKKYFKRNKCTMFKREPLEEWLLSDLDNEIRASMFALGRDSAINGMRNDVALVIDDLSDGFDQINNDQAHKDMVDKYDIDMDSRKEDENVPELIIGTMFNENDVQNSLIERAKDKYGEFIQIKDKKGKIKYKNSYLTPNKEMVVILVDCFDEKGNSLAPKLISTEKLLDKQRIMKPYQFDLVYRQKRSSREPRTFEYDTLMTYSDIGANYLEDKSICVLDPTRKNGSDYLVLKCYKKNTKNGFYRFVDVICEQKSFGKVNDPTNKFANRVADFLIKNNCINLYIENNTSNLIGTFLEMLLKAKGYNFCKIEEKYSTKTKGTRILDMETTIKNNIEFPRKNLYPIKHPMTIAMELLTKWDSNSVGKKGNFDDMADTTAMFADKFIYGVKNKATIRATSLPLYM